MDERICDVMSSVPVSVDTGATVSQVALVMLHTGRRQIAVVDARGELLGVLDANALPGIDGHSIQESVRPAPIVVDAADVPINVAARMLSLGEETALVCHDGRLIGEFTLASARHRFAHC